MPNVAFGSPRIRREEAGLPAAEKRLWGAFEAEAAAHKKRGGWQAASCREEGKAAVRLGSLKPSQNA